jgi:hypothetical protein
MAKDEQPFEVLSETAERVVENARGAMDNYFRFLQNMCSPDLNEKMSFAEQAATDATKRFGMSA